MENNTKIKIVFIGGYGRSGSTLLEQLLGQVNGFFPLGEARFIWQRSFLNNELCSCGERFSCCDFWKNVIMAAFPNLNLEEIKKIVRLRNKTELKRNIPKALFPKLRSSQYRINLKTYTHYLSNLYHAVKKISGCEVIIDSSKNPAHGYILGSMPDIDLRVIHMIRDSRGVAYSWLRKKIRSEIYWKREYMPIIKPTRSSIEWLVINILTDGLSIFCKDFFSLKYEDFANNPSHYFRKVLNFIEDGKQLSSCNINPNKVLEKSHSISGNPIRFNKGYHGIRIDDEWEKKLSFKNRIVVTFFSWPLLIKYKYALIKNKKQ